MIRLLLISQLFLWNAFAGFEVISSNAIKAYWIYPLTPVRSVDLSWVELRACAGQKCEEVVSQIPIRNLKLPGSLSLKPTGIGGQQWVLSVQTEGNPQWVLAEHAFRDHWFPSVELCESPRRSCVYRVLRNDKTHELRLEVLHNEVRS